MANIYFSKRCKLTWDCLKCHVVELMTKSRHNHVFAISTNNWITIVLSLMLKQDASAVTTAASFTSQPSSVCLCNTPSAGATSQVGVVSHSGRGQASRRPTNHRASSHHSTPLTSSPTCSSVLLLYSITMQAFSTSEKTRPIDLF